MEFVFGVGVVGFIIVWFVRGLVNDRKSEIEADLEAYEEVHKTNISADNASNDSELSKRVLDKFGKD